jgi:hypothetical protein
MTKLLGSHLAGLCAGEKVANETDVCVKVANELKCMNESVEYGNPQVKEANEKR